MGSIGALDLKTIITYVSYWIAFWTIVNMALPPREVFKDFPGFLKFYNVILGLVGYWGALNLRQFTVKLYDAVSNPSPNAPVALVETTTKVIPASDKVEATKTTTTTPVKTEDK